jgi:FeS assembly SUF system protein
MSEDSKPAGGQGGRDVLDLGHRPHFTPETGASTAGPTPVRIEHASDAKPPSVANGGTPVPGSRLSEEELDRISGDIIRALKTVYDPEIPADIYELGLIYRIDVDDDRNVVVDMTLTAPGCPVAGEMPLWVENAVRTVEGVREVTVNLVFEPPWEQSRMSDEAKLAVGMF